MENHKTESKAVKYLLIGISVLFLFVMLVLPLFVVFKEALCRSCDRFLYD